MTEAAAEIFVPVKRIAPDTIRLERTLDAPVETVWRYLTEANLRRDWFMGGSDATPGGEFDLKVDHDNLSEDKDVDYPEGYAQFKGTVWTEKVIRFDPPRLLETTFQSGKNGTVTYELTPLGETLIDPIIAIRDWAYQSMGAVLEAQCAYDARGN